MFCHMYIALGQGQTILWGQNLDVNRKAMSLCPFVASFKKYLWSLILYVIFHVFIHVYSPGAGADNPLGSEFLYKHKPFVTLVICCKFLPLNDFSKFSPYKSIRDQIWPCRKIGQGQPRVIIWTNYDGAQGPIATYQATGQWPFGSVEVFWRVFTIYGRGSHLGHVTQTPGINFRSPIPLRLHMKFGFDWPSGFEEKDL